MSTIGKKEKHRLKRQQKHRDMLKQRNLGVAAQLRFADSGDNAGMQCFINEGWPEYRQASIFVLRPVGQGHVLAAFLVDLGMAGLKDAWGVMRISPAAFFEKFVEGARENVTIVPCDLDLARQLVAGGIRYAHDNAFRLPPKFERWTAVLGGVDDWRLADTSRFCKEFSGSYDDLCKRYLGGSVDDFIRRTDVAITLGNAPPSLVDNDSAQQDEVVNEAAEKFSVGITNWAKQTGRDPHPKLAEAVAMYFRVVSEHAANTDPDAADKDLELSREWADAIPVALNNELSLYPPDEKSELGGALVQVTEFIASFESPLEMLKYLEESSSD